MLPRCRTGQSVGPSDCTGLGAEVSLIARTPRTQVRIWPHQRQGNPPTGDNFRAETHEPKRMTPGPISLATLYDMRKRDFLITTLVVALWGKTAPLQ
jgi:hypothetical protein